ncbi:MAG: hypothetical protein R3314_12540 [Longimicrobiales bacterium]|nr:hypothetical protein [Longimicrobiales bacterium]
MTYQTGRPSERSAPSVFLPAALALAVACAPGSDAPAADEPGEEFDTTHVAEVTDSRGASMGAVVLAPTCGEAATAELRRGLALLHNMTYSEAERAFRAAADADADCSLAYWGIAMTYVHPLWPDVPSDEQLARGWDLLREARSKGLGTPREEAYVSALEAYYRDGADRTEKDRLAAYADAWERVSTEHPDDPEAALFSALATIATAPPSDSTFRNQREAGSIAEEVLGAIPDHPGAHHYIIHAFDVPQLAERALPVARSYGDVAPDNSHALHMTSHIFTRRGHWEESIEFNRRAAEAAWDAPVNGQVSVHHLHAADYLVYAYLQQGADDEAAAVAEHVVGLTDPVMNHAGTAYALAAIPARMALERHRWEDAAALEPRQPATLPWESYPHIEAITHFARALGQARTGDVEAARESVDRLVALKAEAAALPGAYDWGTQVEIQALAARGAIALAEGRTAEAVSLMKDAAALEATTQKNPITPGEVLPAAELLGDMLLELGRHEEALEAYRTVLERSRNRFNALHGAGLAAERMGDTALATEYYRQLLDVAGSSTTRRDALDRVEGFVAEG